MRIRTKSELVEFLKTINTELSIKSSGDDGSGYTWEFKDYVDIDVVDGHLFFNAYKGDKDA